MDEFAVSVDLRAAAKQLYPGDRYFDHAGVARIIGKMPSFTIMTSREVFHQPTLPDSSIIVDITMKRPKTTKRIKEAGWLSRAVELPYEDFYTRHTSFGMSRLSPGLVEIHYTIEYNEGPRVRFHPYIFSLLVEKDFGTFHQEFLEASGFSSSIEVSLDRQMTYVPGPIWFRNISAEAARKGPVIGYKLEMNGAMMFEDEVELLIDDQAPIP